MIMIKYGTGKTSPNYSVNGQSNIKDFNSDKISIDKEIGIDVFCMDLGINPESEILKILEKEYKFDISHFTHKFTSIEDVSRLLFNK